MITDELEQHEQEQPQTTDYQFVDGDLTEFQKEFSLPKQDMGISEEPDDSEEFIEDEDYQEDKPTPPSAHVSRQTARFITNIIDSSAAFGLSLLSKNNIEQHKADKSAKSEMKNNLCLCKRHGGNIHFWAQ